MENMQLPQAHLYPCFLAWALAPNCMNPSGVSIHGHCFCVNSCQIKWPRWTETWNQCWERGSHPHPTKWPEWPWRSTGIWEHPISITIPVSGEETWSPWALVLFRDMGDSYWGWQSNTTTISHMAGTNHGRYGSRRQSWPDRSCSDWPRKGYPILWTEQGKRCHIYIVSNNFTGW